MKALFRSIGRLAVAAPLFLAGCSGDTSSDEDVGEVALPLPAGSNAQFVSSTIPLAMNPGERLFVQTVMRNTGASSPTNDWNSTYSLSRVSTAWSWVSRAVTGTVTPGNTYTFSYVITAPGTPGTYTHSARMRQDVQFGETASIPNIVVNSATQRQWDCTYVAASSTIPATMTPGEGRNVAITVQNTGTQTWAASGLYLKSQDSPGALWGNVSSPLAAAVAPGATRTFNVSIKAPTTAGTYSLKREMIDTNATGVGFFDLFTPCVNVSITVGGAAALNASVVSTDFPVLMAPSEKRIVTVAMNNTGTQTWADTGDFGLFSRNSPTSLWGVTQDLLNVTTAPAANATFDFLITAPSTPGNYSHVWQMRKTSGTDAAFFGQIINIGVTVDANATAQYNAAVTNQNIPLRITAGESATFDITMQNTGSVSWSGTSFSLFSTNSPTSLWTVTTVPLGAAETVAASGTRQFLLNVTAPAAPGTYASRWSMRFTDIGLFGATALTTGIEVTLCGNSVVDAGETCDDGNLVDGDGCSDECLIETTVSVDLASQAAGRTITGTQTNRQLSTVAIGDVTNDGTPEVVVGENATVLGRNQAGAVYGYSGGTFLNGSTTTADAGFAFRIYGADDLDGFGTLSNGSIVIGDVTGDSVPDLIVGAPGADGASNLRSNSGEVYVFSGAGALTGNIDLAAAPLQLTATLIGRNVDDALRVLAVGDLTGDGVGDLVVGAMDDTNGLNAGAIHIIQGGAGLTGTIDLLTPAVTVHTIVGAAAADVLGTGAAIGDFGGTADNDLIFGASNATRSGRSESGAAYAVFGPISGDRSVANGVGTASGPDVAWIGAGANDHLGGAVAAGNVTDTARADVVIGAIQQRKGGLQFGAANVYAGPLVSGTTYDLNGAGGQTSIILGVDQYDNLGSAIRLADWSGDGVLDIAVAAYAADGPLNDRDRTGEVTVIRGGAGITGTIDLASHSPLLIAYAGTNVDLMGSRTSTLAFGNIDADGRADICVGSQRGTTSTGRVDCFQAQ